MKKSKNIVRKYYSSKGTYLVNHEGYFNDKTLKRDLRFIIKSLNLSKFDKCLDVQCAQGRLTVALNSKGYQVDGLDFSQHMLNLAKERSREAGIMPNFFMANLNDIKLKVKYDKVFMFFPDWNDLDLGIVLKNIKKFLKKGGLFFYDHDSLFRIWKYLEDNPKQRKRLFLDPLTLTLHSEHSKFGDRYYVYSELVSIFEKNGFKIIKVYGDWEFNNKGYRYDSPRLRIIAQKE